jgi:hypothetical protein
MTDFLFRDGTIERIAQQKPTYKPKVLDRARVGLDTSDWYSTTDGSAVEVNADYDSDTQRRSVLSTSLENGVLTVTYQVVPIPALELWTMQMAASDSDMARAVEDLWDVVGIASAPQAVQDQYNAKKALRASKPV